MLDLSIEGEPRPVGVTANHPFWSEDRREFVSACDLRNGELLRTSAGTFTTVVGTVWRPGLHDVYNLQVDSEHVYHVGTTGVLVHNSCNLDLGGVPCPQNRPLQRHHYATNKHSKYTPQMEEIANQLGLDLNGHWNTEYLPHQGRHPDKFHEFVLENMQQSAFDAGGSTERFIQLFQEHVHDPVRLNPDLLRRIGWED